MNKHCIPGKAFREMITGFRKIIPRKNDDLRRLKVDLARGAVTATDGSSFLSYQLGKPISKGASYLCPFDGLLEFAKGLLTKQEVLLEAEAGDKVATFKTTGGHCMAEVMKSEDSFAETPRLIAPSQVLHPEEREAILRALTCASTDDNRYVLRGVFFDDEEGTTQVVGTDGRCLYHEPLRKLKIHRPFILPASPLLSWRGFRHEWQLKVSRGKKSPTMIQLSAGPWTFTTPAIDGNYPDWRQMLPDLRSRPTRITFGDDDLATLEELAADTVGFHVTSEEIRFPSYDKKSNQWRQALARDSRSKGPSTTVYLDPKFLERALNAGVKEACLGGELDPILFRGKGQLVVMPLRISGPTIPGRKPKPPTQKPPAPSPSKPMSNNTQKANSNTPADAALESLKALKTQLRGSIGLVDQTMRHLRDAQADHRATTKDIKTIRGTLQSLKKVAFPN